MILRLIGDTHQNYEQLIKLQRGADYSIALGDIGFDYRPLTELYLKNFIDLLRHRMFHGNHDNIPLLKKMKPAYFLPRRGKMTLGKYKIMFISGGWSIDHKLRTPGLDWFSDEELSEEEFELAKKEYIEFKPDILLTHEGPLRIVQYLTNPDFAKQFGYPSTVRTRTAVALDEMIDLWEVPQVFFGHYHFSGGRQITLDNCRTRFTHLDMIRVNSNGFIYPGSTFDLEI